jgi:activating signal cointegrator 1
MAVLISGCCVKAAAAAGTCSLELARHPQDPQAPGGAWDGEAVSISGSAVQTVAHNREGPGASVPMKALTIWQPHATLVAAKAKRLETRSWRPAHLSTPCLLAIHAGKHFDIEQQERCFTEPFASALRAAGIRTPADLPLSAVLAVAELTDVLPTTSPRVTAMLTEQEATFGNFAPGRWAWVLDNVRLLPKPIRACGRQGLWEVRLPTSGRTSSKENP